MKKFFFVSGMPRSGSTLLCNILNQNPDIYASATSGLLEIMFLIRNKWDTFIEMQAQDELLSSIQKQNVLSGVLESAYSHRDEGIVFDKSRGWLAHIELLEWIYSNVKILVPVRNVTDILASFERIWRSATKDKQPNFEQDNYLKFQTVEGRCEIWAGETQPVGLAYNRIKDALHRGHKDKMFFVRYERLTQYPDVVIQNIYDFLGLPGFEHDFENVRQLTHENDRVHGLGDLHTIRPKVEPNPSNWYDWLGDAGIKYQGLELW